MKIWYLGASSSPYRVDGVARTVWLLSRQQVKLGHQVALLIDTPPEPAAVELAREGGLKLIEVKANALTYRSQIRRLLLEEKPHIVHMHSVFILRHYALGKVLKSLGIPYVVTPHAGLSPQVLRRGVVKKSIYSLLCERPRFMGASAIGLVTPGEERAVRAFLPDYKGPMRWLPNPVDIEQFGPLQWHGGGPGRRIVFLGRFDVLAKGIDVLMEIARQVPEAKFDLYGMEDRRTLGWLNRLKEQLPANVEFHDPVFGTDKAKVLMGASLYLQPSRWEGFPVSVAESLYMGVPTAIGEPLEMAHDFHEHDLGLVLPLDPPRAAQLLRDAMADENRLLDWSRRGQAFAMKHFHPEATARNHIALYEEVLAVAARSRPAPHRASARSNQLVPVPCRTFVKRGVSTLLHRSRDIRGVNGHPRTVVLCFHSIDQTDCDLSIDPTVFRGQLQMLKEQGFEFMDFRGLLHHVMRHGTPRGNVACITFDDGFEDNLNRAAPILLEIKVPATFFVTSGLMTHDSTVIERFRRITGYDTTYLSPRQVEELSRLGFEIGAHTHTHTNLALLTELQAWEEIVRSRQLLESAIAAPVSSFAYPFGKRGIHYTAATVAAVRECGMQGAAAVAFRALSARSGVRIYEIPRFFVTRADTIESFAQKIRGDYDWLGAFQDHSPRWLKGMISPEDRYC